MRKYFFAIACLFSVNSQGFSQVDLSRYYNSDAFKISSTAYTEEVDLQKFKEVNPDDYEGLLDRAINKIEEELFESAIKDLEGVIDIVPEYADAYYLRGICNVELENEEMAEADFKKSIELVPVFAQAHTQLGLIYWGKDEIKQAKKYFDIAYDLDETDLLPVFYKCNIALFHEMNLPKTKRLLNKVIKNDSTFSGAYFFKAAIKMAEGYNRAAIKNFDLAIRYNPEFSGAYLWRGFLYAEENDISSAESDFSELINLNPNDEDFWALRSFLRIEKKEYKTAVEDMIQSIKLQDIDADKYKGGKTSLSEKIDLKYALTYYASNRFHLSDKMMEFLDYGLCQFLQEDYENALGEFEKAKSIDTTEATPYFFSALIYEYLDKLDEASHNYTEALKRDKDIYDAYKKRGMIYESKNELRKAFVDYCHLTRLKPNSKLSYKMRGGIKLKYKDYLGAVLEFNESYKRDSSDMEVLYNRALSKELAQQITSAKADYEIILTKNNNDFEVLHHLAFCEFSLGDTVKALSLCDSSISIARYNPFAYHLKGRIKYAQDNFHDAIFCYNQAISMEQNHIEFYYNRGLTYMKTQNWQMAIKDFDITIQTSPNYAVAYYNRGLCHFEAGNRELGISDLEEAHNLGLRAAGEELSKKVDM